MKCLAAVVILFAVAGTGLAETPSPVSQQQQVLVQLSAGTGTTQVGFRIVRRTAPAREDVGASSGRFCLRLPFDCALVMERASTDGSSVVVRPQIGPIAFEVAVDRVRPTGS